MSLFLKLPEEIFHLALSFVDIPSVCRLYVALAPRHGQMVADYLANKTICVSPNALVTGDPDYIGFALLEQLPPCHVKVVLPVFSHQLVPEWFKRRRFTLVHVVLEGNPPLMPFDLNSWQMHIDTLEVVGFGKEFEYHCGDDETRVILKECDKFSITGGSITSFEVFNDEVDPEEIGLVPLLTQKLILPIGTAYNATELSNLKHVDGGSIYNVPWSQLQVYSGTSAPQVSHLPELREFNSVINDDSFTFKSKNCPKLEKVALRQAMHIHASTSNISELFTESQMAQLVSLKVPTYLVLDTTPLINLQELRMRTDAVITERLPLPPSVTTLQVYSQWLVEGIPAQLKTFLFFGDGDECHVSVNSANLQYFDACFAGDVSLDCPRLTRLSMSSIISILRLNTPNLVSLTFNSATTFPFDKNHFPMLAHLSLGDSRTELHLKQHLKTADLSFMRLQSLSIIADEVTLLGCRVVEEPKISARNITLKSCLFPNTHQFNCRQLQYFFDGSIPSMLQNVTIWWHPYDSEGKPSKSVPPDVFVGCKHLQSVTIHLAIVDWSENNRLKIPASVKQLLLVHVQSKEVWLEFENETTLDHFELVASDDDLPKWSMSSLGLTIKPPSFIKPLFLYSHGHITFQLNRGDDLHNP